MKTVQDILDEFKSEIDKYYNAAMSEINKDGIDLQDCEARSPSGQAIKSLRRELEEYMRPEDAAIKIYDRRLSFKKDS